MEGIQTYTGYFHDGGFIGMKRHENNMELFLQSCEIDLDELIDKKLLSQTSALKGSYA